MLTKLSRETLAEQAARNLIAFIEAQDLKPGKMLPPESKLAADLGVSRPIIREALKSLEGRGIIEVVGGKGAVVKPLDNQALRLYFQRAMQIDREAVIDLFELRESIEVRSAALAAGQRTPEEVTQLTGIVAEMRNHLRDPETYVELDIQFHQLIASMTHNAMIYHLIGAIREAIKDMLHESLLRPITEAQLEHVQVGHEAILSALEQGDAQAAEITMTAHFNDAVTSLIYGAIGSIAARAQVKAK